MMRVKAVIFAATQPVRRETLAALIGSDCNLDQIIADIRDDLRRSQPYDLVEVAGGYRYLTRPCYGEVIRYSGAVGATTPTAVAPLSSQEQAVLAVVCYCQPITRMGIADIIGRPISRDIIAALRSAGLIAAGPRSSQPGTRSTYVTTPKFLSLVGLPSLRDLPEIDWFEKTGLRPPASADPKFDPPELSSQDIRTSNARRARL
jgi:segregation and condensation protein B